MSEVPMIFDLHSNDRIYVKANFFLFCSTFVVCERWIWYSSDVYMNNVFIFIYVLFWCLFWVSHRVREKEEKLHNNIDIYLFVKNDTDKTIDEYPGCVCLIYGNMWRLIGTFVARLMQNFLKVFLIHSTPHPPFQTQYIVLSNFYAFMFTFHDIKMHYLLPTNICRCHWNTWMPAYTFHYFSFFILYNSWMLWLLFRSNIIVYDTCKYGKNI